MPMRVDNYTGCIDSEGRLSELLLGAAVALSAALLYNSICAPSPCLAETLAVVSPEGEQGQEVKVQLASIQDRVDDRTGALGRISEDRAKLESELKNLKLEIVKRTRAIQTIEADLIAKRSEQERIATIRSQTEKELLVQRERAGHRLRALYMYRPARLFESLVAPRASDNAGTLDASRLTYFLSRVREADRQVIAQMVLLEGRQAEQAEATARVIAERAALKTKVESERGVLRDRVQQKELVIAKLAEERQRIEVVLSELKAESLRLESVVAGLTDSEQQAAPGDIERGLQVRASVRLPAKELSNSKAAAQGEGSTAGGAISPPVPFEGSGLRAQRKSLVAPARGQVVRRFGKQRHGEFSDFVFQRGVELRVAPEQPIKVVAPGRVAFSGELPGFGKVVIIDHGQRSYTLYGRLQEQLVTIGVELEKGAPIGTVAAADRRGSNFYFEVRENGAPVNPASLFSNL